MLECALSNGRRHHRSFREHGRLKDMVSQRPGERRSYMYGHRQPMSVRGEQESLDPVRGNMRSQLEQKSRLEPRGRLDQSSSTSYKDQWFMPRSHVTTRSTTPTILPMPRTPDMPGLSGSRLNLWSLGLNADEEGDRTPNPDMLALHGQYGKEPPHWTTERIEPGLDTLPDMYGSSLSEKHSSVWQPRETEILHMRGQNALYMQTACCLHPVFLYTHM
jgi:hypothetical protein